MAKTKTWVDRLHPEEIADIKGKKHPKFKGLLRLAHEDKNFCGLQSEVLQFPTTENGHLCIVRARADFGEKIFRAIGDASPTNVTKMVAPHFVRVADTRAQGRALSRALNIGEALAEEITDTPQKPNPKPAQAPTRPTENKPAPKERPTIPESEFPQIVTGHIVDVQISTGTNSNGKPWTRYGILLDTDEWFGTFDHEIGKTAGKLKGINKTVEIHFIREGINGKTYNTAKDLFPLGENYEFGDDDVTF